MIGEELSMWYWQLFIFAERPTNNSRKEEMLEDGNTTKQPDSIGNPAVLYYTVKTKSGFISLPRFRRRESCRGGCGSLSLLQPVRSGVPLLRRKLVPQHRG